MSKKILIAAGGTGGHVFPAQGFAAKLSSLPNPPSILFTAGGLSSNRYFDKTLFSYKEVICSPILSKHPLKLLKGFYHLIKGTRQALKVIEEFNPNLVVAFGSYYTVPILLAAKLKKVPYILHEANSIPGKANKWLAPYARAVGVHFPMTASLLKGDVKVVGMPLRAGYGLAKVTKKDALAYYGLKDDLPVLLVFGGSQGAKAINTCIEGCSLPNLQIIHITGHLQDIDHLVRHYQACNIPAAVIPFEKNMQMAWSCADLFIGRSGAATIAEALEFEVPGLLIPYPHATDDHQNKNADFLVDIVGSAIKIKESHLTPKGLSQAVERLLSNHVTMKDKAKKYKQRPNQIDLCDLVLNHMT